MKVEYIISFSIEQIIFIIICQLKLSFEHHVHPPHNPCPQLFQYQYDGYEWCGIVEVPSPQYGQSILLEVKLSLPARLSTNYYGQLELFDGVESAKINLFKQRPIRYRIKFPIQQPLPLLTNILYNERMICSGPPVHHSQEFTNIRLEYRLDTEFEITDRSPENVDHNQNYNQRIQNQGQNFNYRQLTNQLSNTGQGLIQATTENYNQPIQNQVQNYNYQPLTNQLTHTGHRKHHHHHHSHSHSHPASPIQSNHDVCGIVQNHQSQFNYGGDDRGRWPWLVAVYLANSSTISFSCGGNLVSNRIVVTAAHCLLSQNRRVTSNEVVISIGRDNISKWTEPGFRLSDVRSVVFHPDYQMDRRSDQNADADIGIVILSDAVQFNKFILPICLWSGQSDIRAVEGVIGTVVGWGRVGNEDTDSPIRREINLPIVSTQTCIQSHELYRSIISSRTYCAGQRNGQGPCNGDSGSGMMMIQNNRWVLRGIVSTGLYDLSRHCNLREYIVFTDVPKYLDWIKYYISSF